MDKKLYYRPKELSEYMGMGLSTLWKKVKTDINFPRPIKMSDNMTVFNIAEVNEYIATRPQMRGSSVFDALGLTDQEKEKYSKEIREVGLDENSASEVTRWIKARLEVGGMHHE